MISKAGKFGAILLIADVITGVVMGKSALDILNRGKGSESPGGWKEALAARILDGSKKSASATSPEFPIQKTSQEWKAELSQDQYRVLRLKVRILHLPT